MKIAICISGQPRYVELGFKILNDKLLSKYNIDNIDFFIHTWWDDCKVGQKFDFSERLTYGRTAMWEPNTLEKIMELYKPKIFYQEKQKEFKIFDDVNYGLLKPTSIFSMFYSIMMVNKIKSMYEKDKNFKYDLVIRTRFDLLIKNFNLDLYNIDPDNLYVSGEINRSGQIGVPNDQFAISSSKNIDTYSDLFNNLENYKLDGFKNFTGENLLKYHTIKNNLNVVFCDEDTLFCDIIKL